MFVGNILQLIFGKENYSARPACYNFLACQGNVDYSGAQTDLETGTFVLKVM